MMTDLKQDEGDPLDDLKASVALRRQAERAEAVAVRRARLQEIPWRQIAVVLGVSKQAVHRKHGRAQ